MQTLSLATATLSQSPSMWLAGSDLLRSKSLDNNSYDSGDWFNTIDWSGTTNGFGKGLPPAADNSSQWDVDAALLADPALTPTADDIRASAAQSATLLRLKASTPLFSLGSAAAIGEKISFPVAAHPGVIVMSIDDTLGADVDPALDGALVVFNASTDSVSETVPALAGRAYALDALQATGADPVVQRTTWDAASGTVSVPARTVAVLVQSSTAVQPTDPPVDGPGDGAGTGGGAGGVGVAPGAVDSVAQAAGSGDAPTALAATGSELSSLAAMTVAAAALLLLGFALRARRRRRTVHATSLIS